MFTKMREFFTLFGHSLPEDASLESVPANAVEFSHSEYKADLAIDPKRALSSEQTLSSVLKQNRDAMGQILEFLPKKESDELAANSDFFAESLRAKREKIEKTHLSQTLLEAIDRGKESAVREMLDKLKASAPLRLSWLLSSKGRASFTDHAGRIFHDITPLQFATWNLDTPMRDLLRSYMTEKEAALQLDELDRNGIDYSMPLSDFNRLRGIAPEHALPIQYNAETLELLESKGEEGDSDKYISLNEKHCDWSFRIFQSALEIYIRASRSMYKNRNNHDLLNKDWLNVGFTQCYLTVPWVNAYCCETDFRQQPNFNTVTPDRKTTFLNPITDKPQEFFEVSGLGVSIGFYKGARGKVSQHYGKGGEPGHRSALLDLAALSQLREVRTNDYTALIEDVQSALRRAAARAD